MRNAMILFLVCNLYAIKEFYRTLRATHGLFDCVRKHVAKKNVNDDGMCLHFKNDIMENMHIYFPIGKILCYAC